MALSTVFRNFSRFKGPAIAVQQNLFRYNPCLNCTNYSQLAGPKLAVRVLNHRSLVLTEPKRLAHGNHAYLWTAEKALSASLLAVIPTAFLYSNPVLDNLLVLSVVLHQHWGIEAMVIDYVRPIIFGRLFPKIALLLVYAISAATLGGLLYYNYHDIGITALVKRFWAITDKKPEPEDPKKKK